MTFSFFFITLESSRGKMFWGAAQQEATGTEEVFGSEEAAETTETEKAVGSKKNYWIWRNFCKVSFWTGLREVTCRNVVVWYWYTFPAKKSIICWAVAPSSAAADTEYWRNEGRMKFLMLLNLSKLNKIYIVSQPTKEYFLTTQ